MDHTQYMQRCLQLAALGRGYVAPNPMVGAVIVHDHKIIAEGWHRKYGEAHAEVNCIRNVPQDMQYLIPGAILYVSLEPCNHTGNTGPCTEEIIRNGIKKVVIGCRDSYEKVNGSGIERLRQAAVEVTEGILEKEAEALNKRFFTFHKMQRPYIILKWAQASNGFMGEEGKTVKISNEISDIKVHQWRAEEAAILVGTNTAMLDNPTLTARLYKGRNPVRIIIDKKLSLPRDFHVFNADAPTIIINCVHHEEKENILFYQTAADENMLAVVISLMHQRMLTSLIVEGGAKLLQSFIDAGLWDEARIITSKSVTIIDGLRSPLLKNAIPVSSETFMDDEITCYQNANAVSSLL